MKLSVDIPTEPAGWDRLQQRGMAMMLSFLLRGREGLAFAAFEPETYIPVIWTNGAIGHRGRVELLELCRGVKRPSWSSEDSHLLAHCEWYELPADLCARVVRMVPKAARRALEILDEIDAKRPPALQAVAA